MDKMAMTPKGVKLLIAGLLVMVSGFILMTGPKPVHEVFNYGMFDFRRLVASPILVLSGIVVMVIAIMGNKKKEQ